MQVADCKAKDRRRRAFAALEEEPVAQEERGRGREQEAMKVSDPDLIRKVIVDAVISKHDGRLLNKVVDGDLGDGATIFSQLDRMAMLGAVLAPGFQDAEQNQRFSKELTSPRNSRYLLWSLLPVRDGHHEAVNKVDQAASGMRKRATITPVQVPGLDGSVDHVGSTPPRPIVPVPRPGAADRQRAELIAEQRSRSRTFTEGAANDGISSGHEGDPLEQINAIAFDLWQSGTYATKEQAFYAVFTSKNPEHRRLAEAERLQNRPGSRVGT